MERNGEVSQNKDVDHHKSGVGNWGAYQRRGLKVEQIFEAAEGWAKALEGVDKPWLVWNVNDDWCMIQQRLVESVGWTPVVGFDPRCGAPKLSKNAILVNFAEGFDVPVMYPHFPMEFTFLFADRLAFWHSDLLIRMPKMQELADMFEGLKDGEIAATKAKEGWRHWFGSKRKRYWELAGCTTRGASKSQFDHGCGWWAEFWEHPNCPDEAEREKRKEWYWDHGTGVRYWATRYNKKVHVIKEAEIEEGHCTKIGKSDYIRSVPVELNATRNMSVDLEANFDLYEVAQQLDLGHLLMDDFEAR